MEKKLNLSLKFSLHVAKTHNITLLFTYSKPDLPLTVVPREHQAGESHEREQDKQGHVDSVCDVGRGGVLGRQVTVFADKVDTLADCKRD